MKTAAKKPTSQYNRKWVQLRSQTRTAIVLSSTLASNASIIKKIMFPKSLLPLSTVLIEMVHFAISWIVIIVFLFINKHHLFYFSWIYGVPLITALQLILIFGIGLVVSSLNIFFRDTERIINILVTMLFYLTPVIFPLNMVPETFKPYFLLNPMTGIVELWRALFLEGFVLWRWIGITAVYSTLSLLGGIVLYRRLKGRFAEVLWSNH